MEIDIHHLIKNNKLFASLDETGINDLISKFQQLHIPKDKFVFRQGDLSKGLYFLASGKLVITLQTKTKERKNIREINQGETFGEIGALSHEARGASAKVLEDSVVMLLEQEDFFELCRAYPKLLLEVMGILERLTRNLIDVLSVHEPEKKHIALLPANKNTPLKKFSELLKKTLENVSGITLLSDYDSEFTKKYKTLAEIKTLVQHLDKKETGWPAWLAGFFFGGKTRK
jgi:CRP-like cAMP-binding protein